MDDFQKVLHHAIQDPDFSQKLKDDPAGTLKSIGVAATPEKIAALQNAKNEIVKAHAAFGGSIRPD
jgi:hypothetical protein